MKNSVKCKNCGTVNWSTAENCLRCKAPVNTPAADPYLPVPPDVQLMIEQSSRPSYFSISRYVISAIILIAILGTGFYYYSATAGLDKENKTTLIGRLYWRKPPPSGLVLAESFTAELKCEQEFR